MNNPINFIQFMNNFKGQNPNEILNNLIKSGKVNQQQLNSAQAMASQLGGQFEQFKSMFGFNK